MTKAYSTPGPRTIYPEFATSQTLAPCSIGAKLLFVSMFALADDQGRIMATPEGLKASCLPLVAEATPRKIATWLRELATVGATIVYVAGGMQLVQLPKWWTYQAGMRRAYPSRWPPPDGWEGDRVYGLPKDDRPGTLASPQSAGTLPAESAQSAGAFTASAVASAGANSSSSQAPSAGGRAREGSPTKEPNGSGPLLTAKQLAAWAGLGPEWAAFRVAWHAKGFRLPPFGTAEDDDTTQRGLLWSIAKERPNDLGRWVAEAPRGTTKDVIAHVLKRWHEIRDQGRIGRADFPPSVAGLLEGRSA